MSARDDATAALGILARTKAKLLGIPEARPCLAGGTCELEPAAAPADAPPGTRWERCPRCFTAREVRA